MLDGGSPMTTTIGSVHNAPWLTFTYVASNPDAQRLIADLLGNFRDIEVSTRTTGDERLVVVRCPNPQRAESLHDVIVTLDWGARPTVPRKREVPPVASVRAIGDAMTA